MIHEPCIFILCGLSFAGKTTLAKELARRRGLPYLSLDEVNTERGVGLSGEPITAEEWEQTYAESYRRLEALIEQGRSVVYDESNFARAQRDFLRALAARHGFAAHVIYVDTPEAEVRRRWQQNRADRRRNDVRDDDFAYLIAHFEPPETDEAVIHYNGGVPIDEWLAQTFG